MDMELSLFFKSTKKELSDFCGWFMIPQIALAVGVLTSRIGVRVRRFCGFVLRGGCRAISV